MSDFDISGQKFGKLLAVKQAPDGYKPDGERVPRWMCVCECGTTTIVRRDNLVRGHTKTCGCSRGKKKGPGIKCCPYNPMGVDCTALKCEKCGWNPHNKELIAKRIKKIKIKVGMECDESDESCSAAEDS